MQIQSQLLFVYGWAPTAATNNHICTPLDASAPLSIAAPTAPLSEAPLKAPTSGAPLGPAPLAPALYHMRPWDQHLSMLALGVLVKGVLVLGVLVIGMLLRGLLGC